VFIHGRVLPGTLVAIYPGTIYYPRNIPKHVLKNNEYLIGRYDRSIIDGL
jgi:hypothetical protein